MKFSFFSIKNYNYSIDAFAFIYSILNILLYCFPLLKFVFYDVNFFSFLGITIFIEVLLLQFSFVFVFIMLLSFIPFLVKPISIFFFIANSVALYFMNTYNMILDNTLMYTVVNTSIEESFQLYSLNIILYVIFLVLLPRFFILKISAEYLILFLEINTSSI